MSLEVNPTIGDLATRLLKETAPVATELCQYGAIAGLSTVRNGDAAMATVVVSVALIQDLLLMVERTYCEKNEREPPHWLQRRVRDAFCKAGSNLIRNDFSKVWKRAEEHLLSAGVRQRCELDSVGGFARKRDRLTVECVNWALQELNGGVSLDGQMRNQLLFQEIVAAFGFFCSRRESQVSLGSLAGRRTEDIDVSTIRPSNRKYDVFISYRRSDGIDVARLLKQELERRWYRCFLDVDKLEAGQYNSKILSSLLSSDNIIFVMTNEVIANLDDPDNPVRIELETASSQGKAITVVAAPRISRSLDNVELPKSLEFLRGMQKYRLDTGEFFDESVDKIVNVGLVVKKCLLRRLVKRIF